MEEEKKKVLVPIVIGVLTLLVLVIGATYAYFAVGINNNFGTTTISASADDVGTVTLTNINSTLSMSLTAADMMHLSQNSSSCEMHNITNDTYKSVGNCARYKCPLDNDCICSCYYYATPSGKSTTENMAWEIGRATVTPNTDANYYSCDYTLSVSNTGTTNMYTAFTNMPTQSNATQARPTAYKSEKQVRLQINDTTYDWYTDGMPSTYTGNMIVSVDNPGHITAGLKFANVDKIDQTDLAGTDIAITIQATNFSCTAVAPIIEYQFTHTYDNTYGWHSSVGESLNYLKRITVNSQVTYKACGVFDGTEVCLVPDDWDNVSDYYDLLTGLGATCTYTDENVDGVNDGLECSSETTGCYLTKNEANFSGSDGLICVVYGDGTYFCE